MSRTQLHKLSIAATRELPDGIALTFAIPTELASTFMHSPGQYVSVEAELNGETVRRSYSICSYHKDANIEIGIKRVDSGMFSNHALTLEVGDELNVLPPDGRFTTSIHKDHQHHYLLIAAGSGITPCLSIVKSVLRDEPNSRVTLLFGNRRIASMMFKDDLAALKDEHIDRFTIINMLSAERQDVECFNGRITANVLHQFSDNGILPIADFHSAFLCGPLELVTSAAGTLQELGLHEEQIYRELFTTGDIPVKPVASAGSDPDNPHGQSVTIVLDGSQTDIIVNASQETVLSAARRAGIDMPFSCAGGMCCTCRCKVLQGKTTMDANFSLAQWEIDAGYTLACQTRPTSELVVLDFDAT